MTDLACPDCGLRTGITGRHAPDCCLADNPRAQEIVRNLMERLERLLHDPEGGETDR